MFKVVSAEIKKMVSKPGIYILAILLAVILVLGVFIYRPTVYQDTSVNLQGDTVLDIYNQFDGGLNAGIKYDVDDNIINASYPVTLYRINGVAYKDHINELVNHFETNFSAYRNCAYDSSSSNTISTNKTNLLQSLINLNNAINIGINNAQNGAYTILTTTSNFNTYEEYYEYVYNNFDVTVTESNRTTIAEICKEYEDNFKEAIYRACDDFFNKDKWKQMVRHSIDGDQSWLIKNKEGRIVGGALLGHLEDLGYNLADFPNIAPLEVRKAFSASQKALNSK